MANSRKLAKPLQQMLETIIRSTSIRVQNRQFVTQSWYIPRDSREQRLINTLVKRGLVQGQYYYEPTLMGWQQMGSSPKQAYMAELEASITWELRETHDKPSYSPTTVDFYRELYGNPAMTRDEVYRLERERVMQNKLLTAANLHHLYTQLTYAEFTKDAF